MVAWSNTIVCSDLCSLHGGKDRLAMSTIWIMSPDLEEVKSVWYGRTIIHNCQGKRLLLCDAKFDII